MNGELENPSNARSHDVWKAIAFSIASLGISTVSQFSPSPAPRSLAGSPTESALATFGEGTAIKHDGGSIEQIRDYEASLNSYAKSIE